MTNQINNYTSNMIDKIYETGGIKYSYYIEKYMKDHITSINNSSIDSIALETDITVYHCLLILWVDKYNSNELIDNGYFYCSSADIVKDKCIMTKPRILRSIKRLKEYGYIDYYLGPNPKGSKPINYYLIKQDIIKDIVKTIPDDVLDNVETKKKNKQIQHTF